MSRRAAIAGSAWTLGRPFADTLDAVIRRCVMAALGESSLSIDDVDTVVTVAADTLDGLLVPARADVAGGYGRSYLNVPSSAGHGLGAAATQIEVGEARTVLLVGWGAAARYAEYDPRINQADPFHARPLGASPRAMAALQANELLAATGVGGETLDAYARAMAERCWDDAAASEDRAPVWARTAFCDGAVAIVMRRQDEAGGVTVGDFASVSRAYSPEDESLDPASWAAEALACLAPGHSAADIVEASAPTPIAEARALSAAHPGIDLKAPRCNFSGGGAAAHFGPATALRQIAEASRRLAAGSGAGALVLDLAGPAGQHATAIALQAGALQ